MEIREVVKVVREKTEEEYTKELSDKLEKNANTVTMTGTLKAQGPFVERKETEIREESSDDTVDE